MKRKPAVLGLAVLVFAGGVAAQSVPSFNPILENADNSREPVVLGGDQGDGRYFVENAFKPDKDYVFNSVEFTPTGDFGTPPYTPKVDIYLTEATAPECSAGQFFSRTKPATKLASDVPIEVGVTNKVEFSEPFPVQKNTRHTIAFITQNPNSNNDFDSVAINAGGTTLQNDFTYCRSNIGSGNTQLHADLLFEGGAAAFIDKPFITDQRPVSFGSQVDVETNITAVTGSVSSASISVTDPSGTEIVSNQGITDSDGDGIYEASNLYTFSEAGNYKYEVSAQADGKSTTQSFTQYLPVDDNPSCAISPGRCDFNRKELYAHDYDGKNAEFLYRKNLSVLQSIGVGSQIDFDVADWDKDGTLEYVYFDGQKVKQNEPFQRSAEVVITSDQVFSFDDISEISPVADYDDDGRGEIFLGTNQRDLQLIESDGSKDGRIPKKVGTLGAEGDYDGDGVPEMFYGFQEAGYADAVDGTATTLEATNNQKRVIAAGDFDQDGTPGYVAFDYDNNELIIYEFDGNKFKVSTPTDLSTEFYRGGGIADFDRDGVIELGYTAGNKKNLLIDANGNVEEFAGAPDYTYNSLLVDWGPNQKPPPPLIQEFNATPESFVSTGQQPTFNADTDAPSGETISSSNLKVFFNGEKIFDRTNDFDPADPSFDAPFIPRSEEGEMRAELTVTTSGGRSETDEVRRYIDAQPGGANHTIDYQWSSPSFKQGNFTEGFSAGLVFETNQELRETTIVADIRDDVSNNTKLLLVDGNGNTLKSKEVDEQGIQVLELTSLNLGSGNEYGLLVKGLDLNVSKESTSIYPTQGKPVTVTGGFFGLSTEGLNPVGQKYAFNEVRFQEWNGGNGTYQSPYHLGSCRALQEIDSESKNTSFELTQDIDCEDVNYDPPSFTGVINNPDGDNKFETPPRLFQGNNHTVSNVNVTETVRGGFFNEFEYSHLTNLEIVNISVVPRKRQASAIAGIVRHDAFITNVRVENSFIDAKRTQGGVFPNINTFDAYDNIPTRPSHNYKNLAVENATVDVNDGPGGIFVAQTNGDIKRVGIRGPVDIRADQSASIVANSLSGTAKDFFVSADTNVQLFKNDNKPSGLQDLYFNSDLISDPVGIPRTTNELTFPYSNLGGFNFAEDKWEKDRDFCDLNDGFPLATLNCNEKPNLDSFAIPSGITKGVPLNYQINTSDPGTKSYNAVESVKLEVEKEGNLVFQGTKQTDDASFDNVFTPERNGFLNSTITITDVQGGETVVEKSTQIEEANTINLNVSLRNPPVGGSAQTPVNHTFLAECANGCVDAELRINQALREGAQKVIDNGFSGTTQGVVVGDLIQQASIPVTQIIDSSTGTNFDGQVINIGFDSTTSEASSSTRNADSVEVTEDGTYLVSYASSYSSEGAGGRQIISAYATNNGNFLLPSESRCYIRNAGNGKHCENSAKFLAKFDAGDQVRLRIKREKGRTGTIRTRESQNLQLTKVSGGAGQIYHSGGQNYDNGEITVNMNRKDFTQGAVSYDSANYGLVADETGWYRVFYSMTLRDTDQSSRQDPIAHLETFNGNDLPTGFSQTYIRNNGDGDQNHVTASTLIKLQQGQGVKVKLDKRFKEFSGKSVVSGSQRAWLGAHKLPDGKNFVAKNTDQERVNGNSKRSINYEAIVSDTSFASLNNGGIKFDKGGDYKVTYHTTLTDTGGGGRHRLFANAKLNGNSLSSRAKSLDYTRGDAEGRVNTMMNSFPIEVSAGDQLELRYGSLASNFLETEERGTYVTIRPAKQIGSAPPGSSGEFKSDPIFLGQDSRFKDLNVTKTQPAESQVDIDFATNRTGNFVYYDRLGNVPETKYLKYNVSLTASSSGSPTVDKLNFSYNFLNDNYRTVASKPVTSDVEAGFFRDLTLDFLNTPSKLFEWNVFVTDTNGVTSFRTVGNSTYTGTTATRPTINNLQFTNFGFGNSVGISADVTQSGSPTLDSVNVTIQEGNDVVATDVKLTKDTSTGLFTVDNAAVIDKANLDYVARLEAKNSAGAVARDSIRRQKTEKDPPNIQVNFTNSTGARNGNEIVTGGSFLVFSVNATDDETGISEVTRTFQSSTASMTNVAGDLFTTNLTGLSNSEFPLEATATDNAGITNSTSLTLDVDRGGVQVKDVSLVEGNPDGELKDNEFVDVSAKVTDDNALANVTGNASFAGGGIFNMKNTGGSTFEGNFTVAVEDASPTGIFELNVTGEDIAGNTAKNSSAPVNIITSKAPELNSLSPANNTIQPNPVDFSFEASCFSSDGCGSAELLNYTFLPPPDRKVVDTTSEWNKGTKNSIVVENGNLTLPPGERVFFNDFEDPNPFQGNVFKKGSGCPSCGRSQDQVEDGSHSFKLENIGSDYEQRGVVADFNNDPLEGRVVLTGEYWEDGDNTNLDYWVEACDGTLVAGLGTENPQFEAEKTRSEVFRFNSGNSYRNWVNVNLTLNLDKGEVIYKWDQDNTGASATHTESIQTGYKICEAGVGPSGRAYVDDFKVKAPGEPVSSGNYTSKPYNFGRIASWSNSSVTANNDVNKVEFAGNSTGDFVFKDDISLVDNSKFVKFRLNISNKTTQVDKLGFDYELQPRVLKTINNVGNNTLETFQFDYDQGFTPEKQVWNLRVNDGPLSTENPDNRFYFHDDPEINLTGPPDGAVRTNPVNFTFNLSCPGGLGCNVSVTNATSQKPFDTVNFGSTSGIDQKNITFSFPGGVPPSTDYFLNASDPVAEDQTDTRTVQAPTGSVTLDAPIGSFLNSPIDFDFTPSTPISGGFSKAVLYNNASRLNEANVSVDSEANFSGGSFTNASASGGVLQVTSANSKIGELTNVASGQWNTISYPEMGDPIVVTTSENTGNGDGLVGRARNVGSTSAEIRVCDSSGGSNPSCQASQGHDLHYFVIDAGTANSASGLEAGTVSVDGEIDSNSQPVTFNENFPRTPVVLTTVMDYSAQKDAVDSRPLNPDSNGFDMVLCRQGSFDGCESLNFKTVGYIALEPGNIPIPEKTDAGFFGNSISNSDFRTQGFGPNFGSVPTVFAEEPTNDGGQEPEHEEVRNINTDNFEIRYCELESGDDCDGHTSEDMMYFATQSGSYSIGSGGSASTASYTSPAFNIGRKVEWVRQDVSVTGNPDIDFADNASGQFEFHDSLNRLNDSQFVKFNVSLASAEEVDRVTLPYQFVTTGWEAKKSSTTITNGATNTITQNFVGIDLDNFPQTVEWNIRMVQSNGDKFFATQNETFRLKRPTQFARDVPVTEVGADANQQRTSFRERVFKAIPKANASIGTVFRTVPVNVSETGLTLNASQIFVERVKRAALVERVNVTDTIERAGFTGFRDVLSQSDSQDAVDRDAKFPRKVDPEPTFVNDSVDDTVTRVEFVNAETLANASFSRGLGLFARQADDFTSVSDVTTRRFLSGAPRAVSDTVNTDENTFIGQFVPIDREPVNVNESVDDQLIRVVNENEVNLTVQEQFERVPGLEFTRELFAVPDAKAEPDRQVVVDRNASEVTKAAVNQALGFFRENSSDSVTVKDDTSIQIIRVRLLQPERTNVTDRFERTSFTGERTVALTPDAKDTVDRNLTADRTLLETSLVEDRQVIGFFREAAAQALNVEDRQVETLTKVEFIDREELNVSAVQNRSFEGERTPEVILDSVDTQDRQVDADRNITLQPFAEAGRVGVGRFKTVNDTVDLNESVEEQLIIVEFIDPEPVSVVDSFQRGLAELTREPSATPDAEASPDRTVDVDREVDVFPEVNDSAEETLIKIDRFNQASNTVFTTSEFADVDDNFSEGLGTTDSLVIQATANESFNQALSQNQSIETFLLARERFNQVSSQSFTVFQEFALGKNIVTGDFASVAPIVERREDQIIYTPINSDLPLQQVIGKEITADASQLGLSLLVLMVLVSYLGYDYYRKRKIVRLYKADREGELSVEEMEKAERYIEAQV